MRTFLLTWSWYGTHLPGEAGTVSQRLNRFNGPAPEPNDRRARNVLLRLPQSRITLDRHDADTALASIQKTCSYRAWTLWATHIRTTHIHVVLTASCQPEVVLTSLKAHASRALNESPVERKRWSEHGSTRYLWSRDSVLAAINYVAHEQGNPIALYINPHSP